MKPTNPKLEALRQKAAALTARIQAAEARETAQHRARRTRALILIGTAFVTQLKAEPDDLETTKSILRTRLNERDATAAIQWLDSEFEVE